MAHVSSILAKVYFSFHDHLAKFPVCKSKSWILNIRERTKNLIIMDLSYTSSLPEKYTFVNPVLMLWTFFGGKMWNWSRHRFRIEICTRAGDPRCLIKYGEGLTRGHGYHLAQRGFFNHSLIIAKVKQKCQNYWGENCYSPIEMTMALDCCLISIILFFVASKPSAKLKSQFSGFELAQKKKNETLPY